jgi:hypothetical protein
MWFMTWKVIRNVDNRTVFGSRLRGEQKEESPVHNDDRAKKRRLLNEGSESSIRVRIW